jgi:ABC-type Fe3+-siderophore transport system permease subunit
MKQSSAANLALLLAIVGWLLAFYGVASQLGDPAPWVSREQMQAHHRLSHTILSFGVLGVLSALWLSGYSFSTAKIRAGICLALIFLPSVVFLVWGF